MSNTKIITKMNLLTRGNTKQIINRRLMNLNNVKKFGLHNSYHDEKWKSSLPWTVLKTTDTLCVNSTKYSRQMQLPCGGNNTFLKYFNFDSFSCNFFLQNVIHRQHIRLYSSVSENFFSLRNVKLKAFVDSLVEKYDSQMQLKLESDSHIIDSSIYKLEPLVATYKDYLEKQSTAQELQSIISESTDQDMVEMAKIDLEEITAEMSQLDEVIVSLVMPAEAADENDVILEVSAGVGGQEAMLFARDIFQMYSKYAMYRGWQFDIISYDEADKGGIRKASANVGGQGVYQYLKYEGGVHRVQRVPKTEKSGRIHTSTMTVAIMPVPTEIEVDINPKDLKITTTRSSGPGGQHVNKTDSAVRIVHLPTGTVAECQRERSQIQNREIAMQIIRSRIYEKELAKARDKEVTQRKLQVGTSGRSEKIRTYNFPQDRVTDHRVGISLHHIQTLLTGGEELHDLMEHLQGEGQKESLIEVLERWEKDKERDSK